MHVVRHGHKKERFKPSFAKHTKTEGDQTCEEEERSDNDNNRHDNSSSSDDDRVFK